MAQGEWYYCLDHKQVEPYEGCRSATRLGPYASREDAQEALERVAERNTAWDEDPRFNDDDEDEDRTRLDGSPID
ncbi:hypothetical protein [Enemella sp. A6]|uniref:hypothetical protein n=1 Tax=Enemella sp. A6 TaxID=3440152 RepID=UPI003EBC25A2